MLHTGKFFVDQLLIPFFLWIFIVAGVVGVAIGVALNVNSARTLRFLGSMNRWISLRNYMKPMEEPHDIGKTVYGHRRWFGAAFAIGGAYTVFMLLTEIKVAPLVNALSRNASPIIVQVLVESIKWFLVTGGIVAAIIGAMLVFTSNALPALEAYLNRWYSPRTFGKGGDKMYLTLDQWVETFPRTAGIVLGAGAAIVLIGSIIVWL